MKKFEKLSKRTLALFLSLVMCLGMLPGTALAADGDSLHPNPKASEDGAVTISKTAERISANEWKVTMTVTPNDQDIQTEPMELVILLDDSGSMNLCTGETEEHEHRGCKTCRLEEHTHYRYDEDKYSRSCYKQTCDGNHWYDGHWERESCYGGELTCKKTEHTHTDACYSCGKVQHKHTDGNRCSLTDADFRLSRKYIATTKARQLVDQLYEKKLNVKVSVVTFGSSSTATTTTPLQLNEANINTIRGYITSYTGNETEAFPRDDDNEANGGTNMAYGLHIANEQFTSAKGQKVIVMLADGDKNGSDPVSVANAIRGNTNQTIKIDKDTSDKQKEENQTVKGMSAQIYTIGFATTEGGAAETTLKNVAGQDDHFYRASNALDLANVFKNISAQLSAMVQDDMGNHVNVVAGTPTIAGSKDDVDIDITDPVPVVSEGSLSWTADNNTIPAGETRTITYTVKLDTSVASQVPVGESTVNLNGTAVLNYKVGDGASQTLPFPLPKDTIQYGTLDQTFVTAEGETVNDPVHEGSAKWENPKTGETEGGTFTVSRPADITIPNENGDKDVVYHYIRSVYVKADGTDGEAVAWDANGSLTVANDCTAQRIKHIYSLDYTVSYEWNLGKLGSEFFTGEDAAELLESTAAPVDGKTYKTGDKYTVNSYSSESKLYTKGVNPNLKDEDGKPTTYVNGAYSFSGWTDKATNASVTSGEQIAMGNASVTYMGTWTKDTPPVDPKPPETPIPGVSKYGVTYEVKYAEGVTAEQQGNAPQDVSGTIKEATPTSEKYFVGQEVEVADAHADVTTTGNGTWEFSGWKLAGDATEYGRENTKYVAMAASGLAFVGEWSFTPEPVPGFTIVKTAEVDHNDQCEGDSAHVGDVINYTITVKNTGTMGLTDINITDTMNGNRLPDAGSLKVDGVPYTGALSFGLGVGRSSVVTYTYTVKETDKGDTITNTVTVNGPEGYDPDKSTPETETEVDRPNIASAKKAAVVKDQKIPDAVAMVVDGRIVYPDANGKIEAKVGETVTLLYAVELRGEVGAAFNIEEEADAVFVGSTLEQEVLMTHSYPAQYVGVLEHGTDTLYFTRTFVIEADPADPGHGKPLTNAITAAGLEPDEDDTETTQVDLLYTVRFAYSSETELPEGAPELGEGLYADRTYKAGDTVTIGSVPWVANYNFVGWTLPDGVAFNDDSFNTQFTMPAQDVTLTGYFANNKATYQVQYYWQNVEDDGYTLHETVYPEGKEGTEVNAGTLVEAETKAYAGLTHINHADSLESGIVKMGDFLVLKVYYDRNEYQVRYAYYEESAYPIPSDAPVMGEGQYAKATYRFGATVTIADPAAADYYTFHGWTAYPDATIVRGPIAVKDNAFTMPADNVLITGYFTENKTDLSYTVQHLVVGTTVPFHQETVTEDNVFAGVNQLRVTGESIAPRTDAGVGHFIYMDRDVSAGDMVDNGTVIRLFYAPESWNWPSNPRVIVNKTLADGQAVEVDVGDTVTWTVTVMNDSDVPYTGGLALQEMLAGTTVRGYYAIWNAYAREELPEEPPVTPPGDEEGQEGPEISIPEDPAAPEDPGDPNVQEELEDPVVPELPETPVVPEEPGDVVTRSILFHAQGDAVDDPSDFDLYPGEMIVFTITKTILPEDGTNLVNTVAIYWNGGENADPDTPIGTGTSDPVTVRRYEVNFYMDGTMAEQLEGSRSDYCLGDPLTAPVLTTRPGEGGTWVFAGWDHAVSGTVTGNDDYYALWRFEADIVPEPVYYPVTYTVSGQIPDGYTAPGTVEEVVSGGYHTVLSAPGDRRGIRDGVVGTYEFTGWSVPAGTAIQVSGPVWITGVWAFVADETRFDPPEPTVPTPTPAPPDNNLTIEDEEVPLANAVGLNDTDHFAYIIGYDDDTVQPLGEITRAEVATIFFRLMTDVYRSANWSTVNSFNDVKAGSWYNNAISTCASAGALKGYEDGTFQPDKKITRAEFAVIAARFLSDEITDDGVGDFSDTKGHWAAKEIRLAAKAGWVQGSGNRFEPGKYITRAEVMTIVNRMLDRVPDAEHMLPAMKKWVDNPEGTWYYEAVQEATNEHDYERDETGVVETWLELLAIRDWKALEAEWANNGGMAVPTQPAEAESGGTENP